MSGKHECPRCSKQGSRVQKVRWSKRLRLVRRQHLCLECGAVYYTVEVPVQRYLSLIRSFGLLVKLRKMLEEKDTT